MKTHSTETILYAVTGMSPAVLTETIWALAQESPPVIPDRIIVITTTIGRQRIIDELFQAKNTSTSDHTADSVWNDLLRQLTELGLETAGKLHFAPTQEHIRVPTCHPTGEQQAYELPDIRDRTENSVFADFILENLRGITDNPEAQVIGSLAGGRKTMSTFLYAAFSLVARPHDRLTHVLVPPQVEMGCRQLFHFPAQNIQLLTCRDESSLHAKDIEIQLADVPFIALRALIENQQGSAPAGFSQLVRQYGRRIDEVTTPLQLELHPSRSEITLNSQRIQLPPRSYVLLHHLAQRVLEQLAPHMSYSEAYDGLVTFAQHLKNSAPAGSPGDWRHGAAFPPSFESSDIRKVVSTLRLHLQDEGANAVELARKLPRKRFFGLDLLVSEIQIHDE